jgi:very-short-patch-repair endonuclease
MKSRLAARDRKRTKCVEARGFRALRFWNTDVLTNTEGVLAAILEAASQERAADLTPTLSSDKERGTERRE